MTFQLRPYQRAALDSLYAYWAEEAGSPLLVLPTGAGKSLVMAALMQDLLHRWPDMRLACVTHVRELIAQNFQELLALWPWAPAGIFSAGLGQRDTQSQILFCGIQSVRDRASQIGHVDVLMIDECHLIGRSSSTGYARFIAGLRAINPDLKLVGLTASPFRLDSGRLDEPFRDAPPIFDKVAYEVTLRELIDQKYLCNIISKATATVLDVAGVHKCGGEFVESELQAAVNRSEVTVAAVDEIIRFGHGRKSWLLFCSGVEHSFAVRDELRRRAITAETVTGETPLTERDRMLGAFKAGRIRAMTNNSVLTTGFNHPGVDLLAMLRPTMSASLYLQMAGRGARNAPGKTNCLILDFAGNVHRHGPLDDIRPRKPGETAGDAPVKICPECASIVPLSVMICPDCGFEFERDDQPKHAPTAASTPILANAAPEWVAVTRRTMHRHEKALPTGGLGTPTVRVDYLCGLTVHRQWICPEHADMANRKFEQWWVYHGGQWAIPKTVAEALQRQGELNPTAAIRVIPDGKWFRVVGYRAARVEVVA